MKDIVVIGAGAIGMASAFRLAKEGHNVTIVDSVAPGSKASSHNAGWVVPTMSEPVPAPGVLTKAMKWLWKKIRRCISARRRTGAFILFCCGCCSTPAVSTMPLAPKR
ncbi:MAG: hypothetical protein DI558_00520 [Corynebacterium propinquum]|nr:MAG: hypothetical protein DI558_00520 [Corynebacterium propinquum]